MEVLNAYLRDLLILHDCVIIPGFGGFVGNYQSARISEQDYFTPPRKAIAFNPQLKHNDGLLANTIVAIEKTNYEQAMQRIGVYISEVKKQLKATGSFRIPQLGELTDKGNNRLSFAPDTSTNFLVCAVGMESFQSKPILAISKPISKKEALKKPIIAMPMFRKVLVASVSGFALFSLVMNPGEFKNLSLSSIVPTVTQEQIEIPETEISHTTAPIVKEEPETRVEKIIEPISIGNRYHVIVGCFSMKTNAEQQKAQLITKNIATRTFPYSNTLTAVSAGSFDSFAEAEILMNQLRKSGNAPSAWVLKRKL